MIGESGPIKESERSEVIAEKNESSEMSHEQATEMVNNEQKKLEELAQDFPGAEFFIVSAGTQAQEVLANDQIDRSAGERREIAPTTIKLSSERIAFHNELEGHVNQLAGLKAKMAKEWEGWQGEADDATVEETLPLLKGLLDALESRIDVSQPPTERGVNAHVLREQLAKLEQITLEMELAQNTYFDDFNALHGRVDALSQAA
jgi:hypothetical protein